METVSIIIPIYNAENYISICLDSVRKQTYEKLEVILIDDGSKDASGSICDEYAAKDPRISVFHRENAGVSASRNFGLEKAKGNYILFADADDTMEPKLISECIKLAKRNKADLVVFGFRYHLMDENRVVENGLEKNFSGTSKEVFHRYFQLLVENEILNPPWNKLVRKDLLDTNHIRFHENYSICEDMAYSIQLFSASKKTVLSKGIYYDYYVKSTGTLVFKFHENYFEALTYFYDLAYAYCNRFHHNQEQLTCLNTLYANRIILFLKQICTETQWSKDEKYKKMNDIRNNPRVQCALKNSELCHKKTLVGYLLRHRRYGIIQTLYRLKHLASRSIRKGEFREEKQGSH